MRKLIFFDIDGTIVTEGKERIIPDSVLTTLHSLHQNGHLCFINTGRALAEVDKAIRELPFDGYVCGCGTYIEYQGEVLLSHTISHEQGNGIIRAMEACQLEWLLEGTNAIYYHARPYTTRIGDFQAEHRLLIPDAFHTVTSEEAINLDFDKFCICLGASHQFHRFQKMYQDILTFIDRGHDFYEVVPKGFSKASGIAFLESHFQISHEDTIAIGDSTNDLPMLEYAGYSIAMADSSKELFDIVDYVTGSVLDNGIYNAMQHLGLI